MKNFVFILFFVFSWIHGYSQYVYYGYPTAKTPLKKGNVVILNIPIFSLNSGYNFVELKEFDSLIELLKINDANTLRIEINNFIGIDSSVCEFISNHLCNNIKEILSSKTTLKNYYIISNGSKNPISCKKEDTWVYIYLNSRIEIIVE